MVKIELIFNNNLKNSLDYGEVIYIILNNRCVTISHETLVITDHDIAQSSLFCTKKEPYVAVGVYLSDVVSDATWPNCSTFSQHIPVQGTLSYYHCKKRCLPKDSLKGNANPLQLPHA